MSLNIACGGYMLSTLYLEKTDLDNLKANNFTAKLNYIWDHICDYICSTRRVEAKALLYKFLDTTNTENDRAKAFTQLKCLVAQSSSVSLTITAAQEGGCYFP